MLVLSRKVGESIVISTPVYDIEITVLRIGRNQIRIGVDADCAVDVSRAVWVPKPNGVLRESKS